MTSALARLIWLLAAIILCIAAWRILILRESRSSDQKKLIDKTNSK